MRDIETLLNDYHVAVKTSGPEISPNFIGMPCPFCGDDPGKTHLGYSRKLDLFSCWKCGPKSHENAISRLLGIPYAEAAKLLESYFIPGTEAIVTRKMAAECHLPREAKEFSRFHRDYLTGRGFDPETIAKTWGVKGASTGDWADRLIIPVTQKGKLVSFVTRAIDDTMFLPKKSCPLKDEVIHHKDILYGADEAVQNYVILVEGPADTWRFGPGTVSTFGIKYSEHQLAQLTAWKHIFICYDSIINDNGKEEEKAAQAQAERIADTLGIFNQVYIVDEFKSDPGAMSNSTAMEVKTRILKLMKRS